MDFAIGRPAKYHVNVYFAPWCNQPDQNVTKKSGSFFSLELNFLFYAKTRRKRLGNLASFLICVFLCTSDEKRLYNLTNINSTCLFFLSKRFSATISPDVIISERGFFMPCKEKCSFVTYTGNANRIEYHHVGHN